MKAIFRRTAVEEISIELRLSDQRIEGDKLVIFLGNNETDNWIHALGVVNSPESAYHIPKEWLFGDDEVTEEEALDMLPDVPEVEAND